MSWGKNVTIWCDGDAETCHRFYGPLEHGYVDLARNQARQAGWAHKRGRDLCPQHAKEAPDA